jgi:hypothetical protein
LRPIVDARLPMTFGLHLAGFDAGEASPDPKHPELSVRDPADVAGPARGT